MLYNSQDCYRKYIPRIAEFAQAGFNAGLKPASSDTQKNALVLVDMQGDFVWPDGNLPVANAEGDTERTINFIYKNIEKITTIVASLDTHNIFQIFYPGWWKYIDTGEHPAAYTLLIMNNKTGEIADMSGRRVQAIIDPIWSVRTYLPELKANAQKDLMIWPYHCMEGTAGRDLVPALAECLAYYAAARLSQVHYITKGTAPRTEHYGIWGAEVADPRDTSTSINTTILDLLATHDLIYVAGQARTHCVLATMKQTVEHFANQPEIIQRIRFLRDCTSDVVAPGVDFTGMADAEFAKMQKLGVRIVNSTDAIG